MALFRVTVKNSYKNCGVSLEKGMSVEITSDKFSSAPNLLSGGRDIIAQQFNNKYAGAGLKSTSPCMNNNYFVVEKL